MIPYRCGAHVIPGSVKPETCGHDGGPHASPSPSPSPSLTPPPPPPRTAFACPPVPDYARSAPRASRTPTIVVDVHDYLTGKGIPGVTVMIHHQETCTRNDGCTPTHAHPPAVLRPRAKTDATGRATFRVPDLDYGGFYLEGTPPPGYLDWSSIYNLGAKQCHELSTPAEPFSGSTKRWVATLVPTSMLDITTDAQALAIAEAIPEIQQWLTSHRGIMPIVRGGGTAWQVIWAVGDRAKRQVHVNAFDGTASVTGRWTD
jgi:hypothetical protein